MAIRCHLGCGRLPGTTPTDWNVHYRNVHQTQNADGDRTPTDWEHAAEQLIRHAATTGQEFLIADVLAPLGEHPTPGRRQYINGRIANTVAGHGLIQHAPNDAAPSSKPTSNSSLVRRWVGTERATGKRAA